MKLSSSLIFAFALIVGCTAKPLIKSSDPSLAPKRTIPVLATPSSDKETKTPASQISAAPTPSPATDPGYIVNCNGTDRTLASCYEQADEICAGQKHFVSNILKIEDSKSEGAFARSLVFRCNTKLDYGSVGFPDNGRSPHIEKKPTLQQRLLLGQ